MREVCIILTAIVVLTMLGALLGFAIGAGTIGREWNQEMISRGLMQYNQQTGKLEWTAKAGGENPQTKDQE